MKKLFVIFIFLILFSVSFSFTIVATINPYYLLVKEIVQNKADVYLLLKPGINPHVYSLKVSDVQVLNKADLIIANGLLEPYLTRFDKVFYISNYIPELLIDYENPHFWLDPFFVKFYVLPSVVEKLSSIDPSNRSFYENNAKILINKLDKFIFESFEILKKANGKILVHHPSFYYYFKEFGVDIIWIEEGHNTSTSIKELLNIIKTQNISAIFSEIQQSKTEIEIISKELNKKYYILDPLGIDAKNFMDIYYKNLNEIRKAIHNE